MSKQILLLNCLLTEEKLRETLHMFQRKWWKSFSNFNSPKINCQGNSIFSINSKEIFSHCHVPNRTHWKSIYFLPKNIRICVNIIASNKKALGAKRTKISFYCHLKFFDLARRSSSVVVVNIFLKHLSVYWKRTPEIYENPRCLISIKRNLYANFHPFSSFKFDQRLERYL